MKQIYRINEESKHLFSNKTNAMNLTLGEWNELGINESSLMPSPIHFAEIIRDGVQFGWNPYNGTMINITIHFAKDDRDTFNVRTNSEYLNILMNQINEKVLRCL